LEDEFCCDEEFSESELELVPLLELVPAPMPPLELLVPEEEVPRLSPETPTPDELLLLLKL
jgi:hypothetical protein